MLNNKELELLQDVAARTSNRSLREGLESLIKKYQEVRRKLSEKPSIAENDLRSLRLEGLSIRDISRKLKVSETLVSRMVTVYGLTGVGGKQEFNFTKRKISTDD